MERHIRSDTLTGYCTITNWISPGREGNSGITPGSQSILSYISWQRHFEGSWEGRCEQCAARLAPWPLKAHKIQKYEDILASILVAGITPRNKLDQTDENIIPTKGRVVRAPPISLEMLETDNEGWHLGFDGSARTSDRLGRSGFML
ncbi:hypothetical protein PHMEG_0003496 [Phytophthora megakarya]|uniref:Reverse transcriptase n=1 Tax=Phytophthora megakarya TaxID=4795 RepID=A0A225WW96_9STRA|nr:hypothetical protein PHMEG_0003496 [Phytophthora megakarya]